MKFWNAVKEMTRRWGYGPARWVLILRQVTWGLIMLGAIGGSSSWADEIITINARGQAAGGVWPTMQVWVNGVKVSGSSDVSVGDGSTPALSGTVYSAVAAYSFTSPTTPATASRLVIDVAFTNDATVNGQDRNLLVSSVVVRGQTFKPSDLGVLLFKNAMPDNIDAATEIIGGNGGTIAWTGTLRFSTQSLLAGTCTGAGYSTVAAAIAAAQPGDTIPICAGTYTEALTVNKSLGLVSATGTNDVTINGNDAPAITLANDVRLTTLRLMHLKLQSNVQGLYANATSTPLVFIGYNLNASTVGNALDFSNGNVASGTQLNSDTSGTINSTAGNALVFNAASPYAVGLYSMTFISKKSAVVLNGPGTNASRHSFSNLVVDTTSGDTNAHGLEVHSGTATVSDTTVKSGGRGLSFDGTPNLYAWVDRVNVYSVGDGLNFGVGYGSSSTSNSFSNMLVQTSGSGSRGIVNVSGYNYNKLTIRSDGDAIVCTVNNQAQMSFVNLNLSSSSGAGINLPSYSNGSGNSITIGGDSSSKVVISAKTTGINLNGLGNAAYTLAINNVSIDGAQAGIVTGGSLGHTLSLGTLGPVVINTPLVSSGSWAVDLAKVSSPLLQNLTVNSANGGIHLASGVTGNVSLQGTLNAPVTVSASGSNSHALRLENTSASNTVSLDYVTLKAQAGVGLQTSSSVNLSNLSNFDIQSMGDGVYIANQTVALSLSNGTVRVTQAGANGIYLAVGSTCNQSKTFNNITATAGDGGTGLYVGCASTVGISAACVRNGSKGMEFGAASGRISITGSAISGASYLGLNLASSTSGGSVSGSCVGGLSSPVAQATAGQSFSGNYWQGNSSSTYTSGNIRDNSALASCPLAASFCPATETTTSLLAAYDFEEGTQWVGGGGEIKDTAASVAGPYNGQLYVVGGASATPVQTNTSPARIGSTGTCSYAQLSSGGAFAFPNLPTNTSNGAFTTVSFWMKWDGTDRAMPIGWRVYDLWFYSGYFGFNTGVTDIYGVASTPFLNTWRHVVAVFANGDVTQSKLYVDGVAQTMAQRVGTPSASAAVVTSTLRAGGWTASDAFFFSGAIDQLRVYDGALSQSQVTALYNEAHNCGGQLVAQYRFEESTSYNGTAGELKDSAGYTGGPFNGKAIGQPLPDKLSVSPARAGSSGTCGYVRLNGPQSSGSAFDISGLPVSTAAGAQTSVALWMYWDGTSGVRVVGWDKYDLWLATSAFGFNTSNNDVQGFVPSGLAKSWHHVVAVFTNGDVTQNQLYLDGVKQSLGALQSASSSVNAVVQSSLRVGGWVSSVDYRFAGYLDELKVYNGALTQAQVTALYNETHACAASGPVAEWRMDELSWATSGEVQETGSSTLWRGDSGAVLDSGPYGLHGTAKRSVGGTLPVPTANGKVCGAGDFSGSYNHVAVGNEITDKLSAAVTVMAWVKQPSAATYNYIFSNARDCCGSYRGFNLAANYVTQAYAQLWKSDQALSSLSVSGVVPVGAWAHVAMTFDGNNLLLYVNGVLKGSKALGAGITIGSPASWPGVIGALANCATCDANMSIDEVKIWGRALSATELLAVYTNENNGLNWDGSTRQCGNQAPVSDWHYDEYYWTGATAEVKDSSGNANHAQAVNGALTTAAGKLCRAGSLAGTTGDGLQDGVQSGIPITGLSSKAISTSHWVKFNTLANEQLMLYVGYSNTSTSTANRFLYLSTWRSDGPMDGMHFGVANVGTPSWGRAATLNSSLFQTGVWYHVVTVIDAQTGRLTAYINGTRIYDATTTAGLIPGTPTVIYVGSGPEGGRVTNALFDEVLLFNGALTATQVQAIYSYQSAGKNWDGSTRTCPGVPGAPGLLNAFDSTTVAGAISGYVTTRVAGNAVTIDVVALTSDKTAVDTSFNQTVKVELVANADVGVSVNGLNCPATSSVLASAKLAVINGRTTVTLPAAANVWRDARIRLSFPATGTASIVACSNDNFAVRPWALGFQARDADWQTAGNARTLDASTESASPTHKAGQPFSLVVSAYDSGGALSTNYAGTPSVTAASCQLPASGCVGGLLQPGSFSGGGGTVSSSTATHSEAGVIKVQLQDDTFAQVDGGDGSTVSDRTAYSPLVTVGRFVPDHFSVIPVSATPGCTAGSTPFTYLGQDGLVTVATLIAQNAQNQTTRNYTGSLARLDLTRYASYGFAALDLPAGSVLGTGAAAPTGSWSQGVALLTQASHVLSKPTVAVVPASVTITTTPLDLDGVTVPSAVTLTSAQRYVHGRLKLGNAFGAASTDLVMSLTAQIWDGSRYVTHSADSCTNFGSAAVGFRNFTSDLTSAETGVSHLVGSSWRLSNGSASLRVARPSAGDGKYRGSSDVFVNLGGDAVCSTGSSMVATGLSHLQDSWSWTSGLCSNPVGRLTYGADRQTWLFRREVY